MEITLVVDTAQGRRRFGVLVEAMKDLSPVLKEFDRFKRAKIQALFDSGGDGKWAPLSEQAELQGWKRAVTNAERAPSTMLRKLQREYGRALFRSKSSQKSNSVIRRGLVLAEFERQVEGGKIDVAGFTSEDRRLQKSVRGLEARFGRAVARAGATGRVLGNLPRTIRSEVNRGTLTIDSSWKSAAPQVLQEGGTVNHGAEVPGRPYLFWEPEDVEKLIELLRQRAMLAWSS